MGGPSLGFEVVRIAFKIRKYSVTCPMGQPWLRHIEYKFTGITTVRPQDIHVLNCYMHLNFFGLKQRKITVEITYNSDIFLLTFDDSSYGTNTRGNSGRLSKYANALNRISKQLQQWPNKSTSASMTYFFF